jgi:hypothetical protein
MTIEMDLYRSFETAAREAFQKFLEREKAGKSTLLAFVEFEDSRKALRIYASSVGRERREAKRKSE